jgi:DNA-binding response OmpR family regulator
MQSQVVILSGGRDSHLLQFRNEVLKLPGYIVVSAYSPEELIATFRAGDFDVVLLCHTFSSEEQRAIALAIHAQSPSTPVMVISNGESRNASSDLTVPNDPDSLLSAITGVASHQFHRDWRERAS